MISVFLKSIILSFVLVLPAFSARTYPVTPVITGISQVPELTLENVYREILFKDIKYPEIVMRQVVWETQWLNCRNCSLKFNNLFGFMTKNGYMHFNSWVDCIKYYKKWQSKLHVENYDNYYSFLVHAKFALGESYNSALRTLNIKGITEKFATTIPDWLRRL